MAKKRASKAAAKATAAPTKQTPAMYPTPAPWEVATPQKIVAIDLKMRTITIEGPPPPELVAAAKMERRRLNLVERIAEYTRTLALRIAPHWGERPKRISPAVWRNPVQRINAMAQLMVHLPETAPAEAQQALMALQTMNRLAAELAEAGDYPESIDRAICWAIDLGLLLQRGQTQIDYGTNVDSGKRNAEAVAGATEAKRSKKSDRSEAALAEFNRRMATVKTKRMKTALLKNMSQVMDGDGTTPKWGSLATLKRWSLDWIGRTPME